MAAATKRQERFIKAICDKLGIDISTVDLSTMESASNFIKEHKTAFYEKLKQEKESKAQ